MGGDATPRNIIEGFVQCLYKAVDKPVTYFREKVVEPNRQPYPWYHQKFRRVPTIDECYTDDFVCIEEANQQYKRDRLVDNEILNILRQRFEDCVLYEAPDAQNRCKDILKIYQDAEENWFIKYGDLGGYHNVKSAFMKQKHRMIWERRHGKVGSGRKTNEEHSDE